MSDEPQYWPVESEVLQRQLQGSTAERGDGPCHYCGHLVKDGRIRIGEMPSGPDLVFVAHEDEQDCVLPELVPRDMRLLLCPSDVAAPDEVRGL